MFFIDNDDHRASWGFGCSLLLLDQVVWIGHDDLHATRIDKVGILRHRAISPCNARWRDTDFAGLPSDSVQCFAAARISLGFRTCLSYEDRRQCFQLHDSILL
jgi:hypothetical protein